ncbi:MAG: cryptochrome/photolyase family protein, partial [Bacteroidota bacterium]
MARTLRLILGDQLNAQHSWFNEVEEEVTYVMMEVRQETDYVKHHIQKVVAFFAAMRAFSKERQTEGHHFIYLTLDDPANLHDIPQNIDRLIEAHQIARFEYQLPDEYRLDEQLKTYCEHLTIPTQSVDTEHFLTERGDLKELFKGKKTYLMETFYRTMRKKYQIMMETETQPVTGKWNYDANNRNKYDGAIPIPEPLSFQHDVAQLVEMIEAEGVQAFGEIDPKDFIG